MKLNLYRGIRVAPLDVDNIKENILSKGMDICDSSWKLLAFNQRESLNELFVKPDLTTMDTIPGRVYLDSKGNENWEYIGGHDVICACGDLTGANYYASRGDENKVGLIISFMSDIENIQIDGRDFLYSIFHKTCNNKQYDLACKIFGVALGRYLKKAMQYQGTDTYKSAMCDLARQDSAVIVSHHKNKMVLAGRYGTRFCSAFFVRSPIVPSEIKSVKVVRRRINHHKPVVSVYKWGDIISQDSISAHNFKD